MKTSAHALMPVIQTVSNGDESYLADMAEEAVNSVAARMTYEETSALRQRRWFVKYDRLLSLETAIRERIARADGEGLARVSTSLKEAERRKDEDLDALLRVLPASAYNKEVSLEMKLLCALLVNYNKECDTRATNPTTDLEWDAFMDMERGADEIGRFLTFCDNWDFAERGTRWSKVSRETLLHFIETRAGEVNRGSLITFVSNIMRALTKYRRSAQDLSALRGYMSAPMVCGSRPADLWGVHGLIERMKDARSVELGRTDTELPWNSLTWFGGDDVEDWHRDATRETVESTFRQGVPLPLFIDKETAMEEKGGTMCVWKDVVIEEALSEGWASPQTYRFDFAVLTSEGKLLLVKCANVSSDVREALQGQSLERVRELLQTSDVLEAYKGSGMRLVCGDGDDFDRKEIFPRAWRRNWWGGGLGNVEVMWITPNTHASWVMVAFDSGEIQKSRYVELLRSHASLGLDFQKRIMTELVRNIDPEVGFTRNGITLGRELHPRPTDLLTKETRERLIEGIPFTARLAKKLAVTPGFGPIRTTETNEAISSTELGFWSWKVVSLDATRAHGDGLAWVGTCL